MNVRPYEFSPDTCNETITLLDRRIRELEQVRKMKPAGSWLYEMDTTLIQQLTAEREWLLMTDSHRERRA
jgi:hypothetical protein